MAELDFSHNVQQIPAGELLPKPFQRSVGAETFNTPNYQEGVSNYAASTNWMSTIGSYVASRASNSIASQMGTELGKNPKGDIGIPLTDFDQVMYKSYYTQAQATLGLQANKLITDSNIELAKASRITPDLIEKTNQSIAIGLKNIFNNAPSEIRPQLENYYANQQMQQTADLSLRMIREQKEDQRNNTALSSNQGAENAYSFTLTGNEKAGEQAVKNVEAANNAAVAARVMTPEAAKVNIDTARKAFKNGKYIHEYELKKAEGKGEEYLKSIADGKVIKPDDPDYMSVTNNLMNYIGHQNALRSQDEQLRIAQFRSSIAQDVGAITPAQLMELKENVSPLEFERANYTYLRALNRANSEQLSANEALASWNDPAAFARLGGNAVDKAFDMQVTNVVNHGQKNGANISRDEAEVQVAASAGGQVPIFTKSLNNKFSSPNPVNIESASRQVELLHQMNAGNALAGLSKESRAMYTKYKAMRDSMEPQEAAQKAYDVVYNQDPATIEINNQKWTNFLSTKKPQGQTPDVFALKQVGLEPKDMRAPTVYGNDILEEYKTYYTMLNGDEVNAKKMLQESVDANYGETFINGQKETTKHPIEKVLNLPHDAIGVVQQDIVEQLESHFANGKKFYDGYTDEAGNQVKPSVNEYWEVIPRTSTQDILKSKEAFQKSLGSDFTEHSLLRKHGGAHKIDQFNKGEAIQVVRHMRGGKSQKYNVVIQMNPFSLPTGNPDHPIEGGWDISVDSGSGIRPLLREAPYLGVVTYSPNVKRIQENYMQLHQMK